MDKTQETFETWNNIAALYQARFMQLPIYNATYDHFCQKIEKANARLLDIGCGPGNITRYLLSKRPDFDILGIDTAPNMIELARQNNPSATFSLMDARHIGSLNQPFDGLIAGFCLPYLSPDESDRLISDAAHLLLEGGWLYLSFVAGRHEQAGYKTGSGGRVYFYYHEPTHLLAQLSQSKFTDFHTFEVPYKTSDAAFDIHTVWIARKHAD